MFREMGCSFTRCAANGQNCPDSHLRPPLPTKPVTRWLWSQLGTVWVRICTPTKPKASTCYTISRLKHRLFSNKLFNKTFHYLIKLLPLKYLCSMLPSSEDTGEAALGGGTARSRQPGAGAAGAAREPGGGGGRPRLPARWPPSRLPAASAGVFSPLFSSFFLLPQG